MQAADPSLPPIALREHVSIGTSNHRVDNVTKVIQIFPFSPGLVWGTPYGAFLTEPY